MLVTLSPELWHRLGLDISPPPPSICPNNTELGQAGGEMSGFWMWQHHQHTQLKVKWQLFLPENCSEKKVQQFQHFVSLYPDRFLKYTFTELHHPQYFILKSYQDSHSVLHS